jgi:hypothetical protein
MPSSAPLPSKWNDGLVHVSRPFGRVSIDGQTLRAWATVPLLSWTGLRVLKRQVTIDLERPCFRYKPTASLYVPTVAGGWFRTSIANVERRLGEAGVSIEVGRPPQ